jgi:hypothetical protein
LLWAQIHICRGHIRIGPSQHFGIHTADYTRGSM